MEKKEVKPPIVDIHKGHRKRVRTRFLSEGMDKFAEHEVLEMLLFYAVSRADTNELAHELIHHFGSLAEVFDASYEELRKACNLSENTAILISMMSDVARAYRMSRHADLRIFDNPQCIGEYFTDKYMGITKECVYLLLLDNSLRLIYCGLVANGTVTMANVSVRMVMDMVVKHNACNVVMAHNHPRGLALPSAEDLATTSKIRYALKQIDVQLVEHTVVSQNEYISLVADGFVKQ